MRNFLICIYITALVLVLGVGCSKKAPSVSDDYADSVAEANAQKKEVDDMNTATGGPNLVYIEGGRTVVGTADTNEVWLYRHDNIQRPVQVETFFMDETEVANIHWHEYLYQIKHSKAKEDYEAAHPDTTVWQKELTFNDAMVDHYFRHPGFRFYPVVGVSWLQANNYCDWRSKAIQEYAEGRTKKIMPEVDYVQFSYHQDQSWDGEKEEKEPEQFEGPRYRLPTEDEWMYAAMAYVANTQFDKNQSHRRIYPWDGHTLRYPYPNKGMGTFLANFKRGRGDYAGTAGKLNDKATYTEYIYAYPPNEYGLYNMAGNVNEWVFDEYYSLPFLPMDANPNTSKDQAPDSTGTTPAQKELDKTRGFNPYISPTAKIYKGGSWNDIAYWLSPSTRRFLDEDESMATLGFRCAMSLKYEKTEAQKEQEKAEREAEEAGTEETDDGSGTGKTKKKKTKKKEVTEEEETYEEDPANDDGF